MRIALTKSTLRIPPTYFALSHAERMRGDHDFRFFTLAADVADRTSAVPITDFVPFRGHGFRARERWIPLFMPAMAAAVRNYRPDLIHQHFGTWSGPAVAAARGRNPLITTMHGADVVALGRAPTTAMHRWHRRNVARAAAASARVLAVSSYLAEAAVRSGVDAAKVSVHYQGIDTDYFTPRFPEAGTSGPGGPAAGGGGGPAQVLFVGALNRQKGILDLVAVSERLHRHVEHELVIVGDGPLRGEVADAAARSPHIVVLGAVGRDGVRDRMRAATVLVSPSREYRGAREAAGLVLLEAQACGLPVVATDSGGQAEMTSAGYTGLVVPEKDTERLRDAVSSILTMPAPRYRDMVAAAREFVVRERSLARSCDELNRHYVEVAAG